MSLFGGAFNDFAEEDGQLLAPGPAPGPAPPRGVQAELRRGGGGQDCREQG